MGAQEVPPGVRSGDCVKEGWAGSHFDSRLHCRPQGGLEGAPLQPCRPPPPNRTSYTLAAHLMLVSLGQPPPPTDGNFSRVTHVGPSCYPAHLHSPTLPAKVLEGGGSLGTDKIRSRD